ncbi:MAG: FAD-dependent oxidoreductase, partial [Desulfatitalea sp.]|nr:FAD-dependent oxidoreductase [Desulfatitalea sp.]NNJ99495.1 FAD-dependent oxidoreductase [Desulfatitalea sp.]
KQVAVIGAGPAGLTTSFYLRKQGHGVTVFDAQNQAGGMMRYGIPAFRLPADVLDREIQAIWDLGVLFKPNMRLGTDFSLDDLDAQGFDAVFLGVGAQLSRRMPLEGCDLPDVLWGIDFLRDVAQGGHVPIKPKVVVIGGGNVAVDVARSVLRCGAHEVSMACLEATEQMPASPWELSDAVAEGVKVLPGLGPDKIQIQEGRITGLEMVACTCVFDEKGNFCPQFDTQSKACLPMDQLILAIGQASDLSFLPEESPIATRNGMIVVDNAMATGMDHVYAGGDAVKAPGAIAHAIAAGRKAAASIDKALGGQGDIEEVLFARNAANPRLGHDDGFAHWPRMAVPQIPVENHCRGFAEISTGYTEDQARREAGRCLQCDLRLQISANPHPPEKWMIFNTEAMAAVPKTEGVFQLLNDQHQVLEIKGTANLREDLLAAMDDGSSASFFTYEEDKMYSKRESELIQKHLQAHGQMPGAGEDDDDLF